MFQFLLALIAGMVTIGGPCILPLLPIILGTSTTGKHSLRPFAIVLGFVLTFSGFAVIFSVFGSFLGLGPTTWRYVSAIVIACFGFIMLFPKIQAALFSKLEPAIAKVTPSASLGSNDLWSGFLLGMTLGAVWTPCAGPILGSILTLVAAKRQVTQAAALLIAFSIGAGIPMLLIAYGGQLAVQRVRALTKYTETIQRAFGLLIILVAVGLMTGVDTTFQAYLLERYPWLFFGLNFGL